MQEKGIGNCEEDTLSYALFPQVALKFFEWRIIPTRKSRRPLLPLLQHLPQRQATILLARLWLRI